MKKIIALLTLITFYLTAFAQTGINFNHYYDIGNGFLICADSSTKNASLYNKFANLPNQRLTYFPHTKNIALFIPFDKLADLAQYRFSIIEDGTKLILSNVAFSPDDKNLKIQQMFMGKVLSLGTYALEGKTLTILYHKITQPLTIHKTIIYGKPIPTASVNTIARFWPEKNGFSYRFDNLKDSVIHLDEQTGGIFVAKNSTDIDFVYSLTLREKLTGKTIFSKNTWEYARFTSKSPEELPYLQIDKSYFKKSGDYEIILHAKLKDKLPSNELKKYTTVHPITIALADESFSKKEFMQYAIFLFAFFVLVLILTIVLLKKRNRKKLSEQEKQKNMARLQLNAVRAQLNPHFLFNALSSVQNLMNKNDIDNTNRYLSKFARLTRNVLESKEIISLEEEIKLLHDYLQMEQLRFGFKYTIDAQADLNLQNTEIPSMLLQPFVENAVKHGLAGMQTAGEIQVKIFKQAHHLQLQVMDNGKGFNPNQVNKGMGLTLSENKIELLNSIYPGNSLNLNINSSTQGTTITITLKNWL